MKLSFPSMLEPTESSRVKIEESKNNKSRAKLQRKNNIEKNLTRNANSDAPELLRE
jgi:hypothetical protein